MASLSTTHKQAELLAYLTEYVAQNNGVAPSFQEMADAVGLKSKSGVHRLIDALVERGKIARIPHRARALQVVAEDVFAGIPTSALIAELARRGEMNAGARRAA